MEVSEEYANAYAEVWELLNHFPREFKDKVPKERLELYESMRNKSHDFHYKTGKSLEEQGISEKTRVIIANLFLRYWATPKDREKILKKKEEELKEMKLEKYKELLKKDDDT